MYLSSQPGIRHAFALLIAYFSQQFMIELLQLHLGTLLFVVAPTAALLRTRALRSTRALTPAAISTTANSDYNEERIVSQTLSWCGLNQLLYSDGHFNYTHAPVTLVPNTFSRAEFEYAELIQPIFNELVDKMARDREFIEENLAEVAKVDDFTGNLMKILKSLPDKAVKEGVNIGVHRSDYMFNANEDGSDSLLQIEINTISSSFAGLSNRVGELHRHLLQRCRDSVKMREYMAVTSPLFANDLEEAAKAIPPNQSIRIIALALSVAHLLYGDTGARVIFAVQPNEKNVIVRTSYFKAR